jgi:hypothetical protein
MPQKKTRQDAPPLEGDPHVELSALGDGTILTSSADGAPYLYQGGRRKRILSQPSSSRPGSTSTRARCSR